MSDLRSLAEALLQPDSDSVWSPLRRFVGDWYAKPLDLAAARVDEAIDQVLAGEAALGHELPPELREWYLLTNHRLEPTDLGHPVMSLRFHSVSEAGGRGGEEVPVLGHAELEESVLRVDRAGAARLQDALPVDLVGALTSAVVWQTVRCAAAECENATAAGEPVGAIMGPLGRLSRKVRGALIETFDSTELEGRWGADRIEDPQGVEYLRRAYQPMDGVPSLRFELDEIVLLADAAQETVVALRVKDGLAGSAEAGTRAGAAKRELNAVIQDYRATWIAWEHEERAHRAREAERAKQNLMAQVPESPEELLRALEALEPKLLRFEKAFLTDFRNRVGLSTVTEGQRLTAAKMLTKER